MGTCSLGRPPTSCTRSTPTLTKRPPKETRGCGSWCFPRETAEQLVHVHSPLQVHQVRFRHQPHPRDLRMHRASCSHRLRRRHHLRLNLQAPLHHPSLLRHIHLQSPRHHLSHLRRQNAFTKTSSPKPMAVPRHFRCTAIQGTMHWSSPRGL